MKKPLKGQPAKGEPPMPANTPASHKQEVNKSKQKAEAEEVAGRHKNDGQMGHKGAR